MITQVVDAPAVGAGSLAVIREGGPVGPECSPRYPLYGPTEVVADCEVDDPWLCVLDSLGSAIQWARPLHEPISAKGGVVNVEVTNVEVAPDPVAP